MLRTLHSETNLLETNLLNKLIFECMIIYSNISHRVIDYQHKRNFPFFNKCCQYFCLKVCYGHYQKINFPVNRLFRQKSLMIIRKKLLQSSLKSSCNYSVVRLWACDKNLLLRTLHCETFYYIGKTKGMFLFIYELLMVDLSELINVLLIRLSYKLIIFSGWP